MKKSMKRSLWNLVYVQSIIWIAILSTGLTRKRYVVDFALTEAEFIREYFWPWVASIIILAILYFISSLKK